MCVVAVCCMLLPNCINKQSTLQSGILLVLWGMSWAPSGTEPSFYTPTPPPTHPGCCWTKLYQTLFWHCISFQGVDREQRQVGTSQHVSVGDSCWWKTWQTFNAHTSPGNASGIPQITVARWILGYVAAMTHRGMLGTCQVKYVWCVGCYG